MHLKANTVAQKYNWSLTGNQFNDLMIRAAKFYTNCNLFIFFLAVLDQKEEQ